MSTQPESAAPGTDLFTEDEPVDNAEPGAPSTGEPDVAPATGKPIPGVPTNVLNEDWLRGRTWDIRLPSGRPAETLDEVAVALGTTRRDAAERITTLPFGQAAPAQVRQQAEEVLAGTYDPTAPDPRVEPPMADDESVAAEPVPDDEPAEGEEPTTPDVGDEVVMEGKAGVVDLIVSGGIVPGVESKDAVTVPTARVAFLDGTKVAVPLADLAVTGLAPLAPADAVRAAYDAYLIESKGFPLASYEAVAEVYGRGRQAAPADVDPSAWGVERVKAFLSKASGFGVADYTRDDDLLPEGHPLRARSTETWQG